MSCGETQTGSTHGHFQSVKDLNKVWSGLDVPSHGCTKALYRPSFLHCDARQDEADVHLPRESDFTTDVPEAVETEVKREELNLGPGDQVAAAKRNKVCLLSFSLSAANIFSEKAHYAQQCLKKKRKFDRFQNPGSVNWIQ